MRIQIAQQHALSDYTSVMNNLGKETEQNTWKIDSSTKIKGKKIKMLKLCTYFLNLRA